MISWLSRLVFKIFLSLSGKFCHLFWLPIRYLFVQSQQWKHPNNVLNLFKVNSKDIRTTSFTLLWTLNRFHTLLWCFHFWKWTSKLRLAKLLIYIILRENRIIVKVLEKSFSCLTWTTAVSSIINTLARRIPAIVSNV